MDPKSVRGTLVVRGSKGILYGGSGTGRVRYCGGGWEDSRVRSLDPNRTCGGNRVEGVGWLTVQ